MRHNIFILSLFLSFATASFAQISSGMSKSPCAFGSFSKATVTLKDGKSLTLPQANIFLKDGHLLYKKGNTTMEANMANIVAVDFGGTKYECVNSMLAEVVDTIGNDKILCATVIDMDAFNTMLTNSREISSLEIRDMVSVTSIDLVADEDRHYPLVKYYYYVVDGKTIEATERSVLRIVPKDKRRNFKTVIGDANFSWGDTKCLTTLLKSIK